MTRSAPAAAAQGSQADDEEDAPGELADYTPVDSFVELRHSSWVCSVAFSPDGGTLASCSSNGGLRLWDARTGAPYQRPLDSPRPPPRRHGSASSHMAPGSLWPEASSASASAAAAGGGAGGPSSPRHSLHSFPSATSVGSARLVGASGSYYYNPAGAAVGGGGTLSRSFSGTSSAGGGGPSSLRVSAMAAAAKGSVTGTTGSPSAGAVAFHGSGQLLAAGNREVGITLWCVERDDRGVPLARTPFSMSGGGGGDGHSLAFLPRSNLLASCRSQSPLVRLWELQSHSGRLFHTLSGRSGWCVDPVASAEAGEARWGKVPLSVFNGHTDWVTQVATSPTATWLVASASYDRTVRVWDARSGQCITVFSDPRLDHRNPTTGKHIPGTSHADVATCVAVSADGGRLLSGSHDGTLAVWDLRKRARLASLVGHAGRVTCCAWTPEGQAVSGGADGRVLRWDVGLAAGVSALAGHSDRVSAVAAAAGGAVATASHDRVVKLWLRSDGGDGSPRGSAGGSQAGSEAMSPRAGSYPSSPRAGESPVAAPSTPPLPRPPSSAASRSFAAAQDGASRAAGGGSIAASSRPGTALSRSSSYGSGSRVPAGERGLSRSASTVQRGVDGGGQGGGRREAAESLSGASRREDRPGSAASARSQRSVKFEATAGDAAPPTAPASEAGSVSYRAAGSVVSKFYTTAPSSQRGAGEDTPPVDAGAEGEDAASVSHSVRSSSRSAAAGNGDGGGGGGGGSGGGNGAGGWSGPEASYRSGGSTAQPAMSISFARDDARSERSDRSSASRQAAPGQASGDAAHGWTPSAARGSTAGSAAGSLSRSSSSRRPDTAARGASPAPSRGSEYR